MADDAETPNSGRTHKAKKKKNREKQQNWTQFMWPYIDYNHHARSVNGGNVSTHTSHTETIWKEEHSPHIIRA